MPVPERSHKRAAAEWLEPYTALGVEKCIHPGCSVSERADPFYSAFCHSNRHAKRMIRFELADGGQYRNDWDARITALVAENAKLRAFAEWTRDYKYSQPAHRDAAHDALNNAR